MARTIMLIPVGSNVGLSSVSLGLVRALERKGVGVNFFKPIAQSRYGMQEPELTTTILRQATNLNPPEPLALTYAEGLIGTNQRDVLLEQIVARFTPAANEADIMVVEGMVPTRKHTYVSRANLEIATTLDAEVVFVVTPGNDTPAQLRERMAIAANPYGGLSGKKVIGAIINKVNAPVDEKGRVRNDLPELFKRADTDSRLQQLYSDPTFKLNNFQLLGLVPWNPDMVAFRAKDMAEHLNAKIIHRGELDSRRLNSVTFCARSIPNMLEHFKAGSLLVTSADRPDVIVAACLSAMNGTKLGALLLTGNYELEGPVKDLCEQAFSTGLPVMQVESNTWQTSMQLHDFNLEIPADDHQRIEAVQDFTASHISEEWIDGMIKGSSRKRRLSPAAFRYQLTDSARKADKRIVLPEGDEPRTVKAAALCAERGIATCVLLGDPAEIRRVAEQQGVTLGDGVELIDPSQVRERYVKPMCELRKSKGLEEVMAREQLHDNVVLGTMMLAENEVDGLVSGAVHTTANTIRPPLQLIKTAPGSSLVSSIFFMLLPEQVLVYGDCAINPDPNAEQLAEIAIQSADSAKAFGIEPKVAMISYSTGSSGAGADVEKVREATELAKAKRPDLLIDGPLQYDAAVMENVAKSKAPNSPVAGQATVFVFPDLNTGNTTYKAVQRSADLISIGPMLQGMRKPVNDLSRGALVDDIVYTIALTAIQAGAADQV